MNYIHALENYINNSPVLIQVLWSFCFVLLFIFILLVFLHSSLRNSLRKKEAIKKKYSEKYETLLIQYLYSEEVSEQQKIVQLLHRDSANNFKRNSIVNTLIKLKDEISGELEAAILKLYDDLDLDSFAISKLKTKDPFRIINGIRQLNIFHVKSVHAKILEHVNHEDRLVRKEVQLYLVKLFQFEGLFFLNKLEAPLSEWNQIQLLEILKKFDNQDIPDVTAWLKSTNKFVVLFALKLVRVYNLYEKEKNLIDLLSHEDQKVRLETIITATHLQQLSIKSVIISKFENISLEEQIAFFNFLKIAYESTEVDFIHTHIYHTDFDIKRIALDLLKSNHKEIYDSLDPNSEDKDFTKIINFMNA
jgi:uncharacterized LabA/DUF88 family protein